MLRSALERGRLTSAQARVLPLLLFIPLALFVGTEASGTRAFVGVIVISLLPELVSGALVAGAAADASPIGPAGSSYAGLSSRGGSLLSVSVVMTCHDEERTIEQAVRSVEAQTIFDSVDGDHRCQRRLTGWVAKSSWSGWLARSTSSRSSRRRGSGDPPREIARCAKRGRVHRPPWMETTSGRLRSWSASFLRSRRSENIGLVYGDFVDFSRDDAADGRVITVRRFDPESAHQLRDYFVHDGPIMPSTLVVRRSVFDDVGLFDESLLIGEDTEFCLRVAEKWRFCHVPGAFTFKRRHPGQISARLDAVLPNAARVTQQFASRHPELRPLAGRRMASGPRKGQCRLCDERRMAQGPASRPPRDPPRPALLARLGQLRPPTRASLCRTALLRGDQEAVACPPALVAFRTTILVRHAVCEFSTC